MAQIVAIPVGDENDDTSRPVSRDVKLQSVFLGLDSLYIVLEYPHSNVFDFWSTHITDFHDPRLYEGIPFEDFLIRRGGLGYKLSVWDGDARLYLTDRVGDNLKGSDSDGQGMGVMLQLGPKWLHLFGDILSARRLQNNIFAQLIAFGVQSPENFPVRLNRIDIALDVLGLRVIDQKIDEWRDQWVGRAQQKHFYDSRSGKLEGFAVGSSSGAIRFKVYDKVAESKKRGTSRFWRSAWGVSEDEDIAVARFEWTIKAYGGRFKGMRYLSDFSFHGFMDLLNYASLKWGRLCIPDGGNQTRRDLAPLWIEIRRLIEEWTFNYDGIASRDYDFRPDLKKAYLKSVSGWLAGLMARAGIEQRKDKPITLTEMIKLLRAEGLSPSEKAKRKWDILTKLLTDDHDAE